MPGAPEFPLGAGSEVGDTSLSEALAILRKQKWVVILALFLGIAYGFYKAYTQPKVFIAYSTIQVRNGSSNEYRVGAEESFEDPQTKMNTEITILKSDTLMTTVAREMNLANNPDFTGATGPAQHVSLDDPAVREGVVGTLQGNLSIALVPKTEMIRIGYSSRSAKLSADIVNRVVDDYIQRSYETRFASTQRVSEWLSGQLDNLKSHVESSQQQMMDLQKRLGVLGFDSTHSQLSESLEDLLKAESSAKIARIEAESRFRMLAGMDAGSVDSSIETTPGTAPGELNSLRSQLANLKESRTALLGTLGPNHPRVRTLSEQIDLLTRQITTEQNRLLTQSRETFHASKAAEDKIEQELDTQKADAYKQRDDLVNYTLVQREFEQNRALYEGLEQRLQTAGVQAGLESLEVDTVDRALPPTNPTMQAPSSIITTRALFFLLGGIVLAFILDTLDTGLHNIAEIETVMEMPSLAIVPRAKRATAEQTAAMTTVQRNINILTQPKSQFTEAFRSLRTSLLLSTTGHPPKFILFTSATPSEGKTTTASNLACVLAQRDTRVLLIDADLRRPNVHHRFGLTGKLGLTTLLSGSSTFAESIQHVPEIPNLDILPSGPVPPFPTEMLSSEAMMSFLEKAGNLYTHVVIDSPPVLSVTDAVILARVVDAVVLVIRHGKSNKHVIRRARELLVRSGAPMAGLVLNAVDLNSPDYYGYYGYSGYSYSSVDSDTWEAQPAGKAGSGGPEKP